MIQFEEKDEKLSICCTANHDERFHYDDEEDLGVCVHCKEWSKFVTEDDFEDYEVINLN